MLTEAEYREYSARNDRYNAWAEQYRQRNGWAVIPAGVEPPADARISNDERSAIEVYEFVNDPPDRYFLYVDESSRYATTWTGMFLGRACFGRAFRDNFRGERVPVTVRAINGRRYTGTYFKSSGNYARIRMAKGG